MTTKPPKAGKPSVELYRYAAASGALDCLSCNPSGARPQTREFNGTLTRHVAALLPAWENQSFAPRVLSEDGSRLFFNSFDALLPRDTNSAEDVYEWELARKRQTVRRPRRRPLRPQSLAAASA